MEKRITRTCEVEVYELPELARQELELLAAARQAAENAYTLHTNHRTGAACRLWNGNVLRGGNQENASLMNGICAETALAHYAGAAFPAQKIRHLAVFTEPGKTGTEPVVPCGSCLQVLRQHELRMNYTIELLLWSGEEVWKIKGIGQLLPFAAGSGAR